MKVGSLCSGYGGLDMAVCDVLDARVAWHAELDPAASRILAHHWPDQPNHGDIKRIDWTAIEPVDVLTAGYPCQPFSHAGKRKGVDDERHLWPAVREAIRGLRPRLTVLENVAGHRSMGFDRVLGDMAEDGLHARWVSVRASDVGAAHRRERLFIVAHPADADLTGWEGREPAPRRDLPAGGDRRALTLLPTARTTDHYGAGLHGDGGLDLRTAISLLPTPKASDGPNGGPGMRNGKGTPDALPGVVALLPTPRAQNGEPRNSVVWERPADQPQNLENALAHALTSWGQYAPAIARWEHILGRPAPAPTEPTGKHGRARLSRRFTEWHMGLPDGWVTAVDDLSYSDTLKALGNGVVPLQAAYALRWLLAMDQR